MSAPEPARPIGAASSPPPPEGGAAPPDHRFAWAGQRYDACDRCGQPLRDHPPERAHVQPPEGGEEHVTAAGPPTGAARSEGTPTGTPPTGPTGSLGHADLVAVARTLRDRADWHWPGPPDHYPSTDQWEAYALRVAASACDQLRELDGEHELTKQHFADFADDSLEERRKLEAEVVALRIAVAAARAWAIDNGLSPRDQDGHAVIGRGVSWVDLDAALDQAAKWDTTCTACARILDAAARDHERAERAEAEVERLRAQVGYDHDVIDELRGRLADGGRP